jgi:hypothetical protein
MNAKKLSQRKHSRLVTEAILAAHTKLDHLSSSERQQAVSEYLLRKEPREAAQEHIKIMLTIGVTGALRGFTDEDLENFIRTEDLARRELRAPGDFVSARSFSAGQANGSGKSESYDHDEIRNEARRIGYFDLKKNSHDRRPKRMEIVKNLNLKAGNPATSDESWNRTISRILDK